MTRSTVPLMRQSALNGVGNRHIWKKLLLPGKFYQIWEKDIKTEKSYHI